MVLLQKNRKTIKSYDTAYALADDLRNTIPQAPASVAQAIRLNAFGLCIHGAKITLGQGWRVICE